MGCSSTRAPAPLLSSSYTDRALPKSALAQLKSHTLARSQCILGNRRLLLASNCHRHHVVTYIHANKTLLLHIREKYTCLLAGLIPCMAAPCQSLPCPDSARVPHLTSYSPPLKSALSPLDRSQSWPRGKAPSHPSWQLILDPLLDLKLSRNQSGDRAPKSNAKEKKTERGEESPNAWFKFQE